MLERLRFALVKLLVGRTSVIANVRTDREFLIRSEGSGYFFGNTFLSEE